VETPSTPAEWIAVARRARSEGRPDEARDGFARASTLCRESRQVEDYRDALMGLAQVDRDEGKFATALVLYRQAALAAIAAGDVLGRAHSLRHCGDVQLELGEHANARRDCVEALTLYQSQAGTDDLDLANAFRSVALTYDALGRPAESGAAWREARELYARAGVEAGVSEALGRWGAT
jgi:tetratricopeptide (TPR) repeat protein